VVIATNETFFASKLSTSLAKSGQPVDLVHHDHIDHLGMQVLEQPLKRRAVQIAAGLPTLHLRRLVPCAELRSGAICARPVYKIRKTSAGSGQAP